MKFSIIQRLKWRFLRLKDKFEELLKLRHPLVPPGRYAQINGSDNLSIAFEYFEYFKNFLGLNSESKVLEVGSGYGRMAIPLVNYIQKKGAYTGIDILKDGINWCNSRFTPKYPHFVFEHINVYNERYNPKGIVKSTHYRFPFSNDTFDCIYVTSVFTHMFSAEVENYLKEINRVLKPNGKCLITFFILNESVRKKMSEGKNKFTFRNKLSNCFIEDKESPEYAVAFEESYIKELINGLSLKIEKPIKFGTWSGDEKGMSFQDIIILKKRE